MKSRKFLLGMLAVTLMFGMTVVGCDRGGTLTVTDIPARFNGMYAFVEAGNRNIELVGAQSVDLANDSGTAARISNGRVDIPMWIFDENFDSLSRYTGSQTLEVEVFILSSASLNDADDIADIWFESVTFSNGSARVSFNDNDEFYEL